MDLASVCRTTAFPSGAICLRRVSSRCSWLLQLPFVRFLLGLSGRCVRTVRKRHRGVPRALPSESSHKPPRPLCVNVRKGPKAKAEPAFARGDIQLNWDFAETNPFGASVGDWLQIVTTALRAYGLVDSTGPIASVRQADARNSGVEHPGNYVVVTDPPYFAAIGYADLSELFYYWMRMALKDICPDLFATVGVPKMTELIASPGRHGGRAKASEYFLNGFTETFRHLADVAHDDFPIVVVYAQKQEERADDGKASTGWEAMLEAIIRAGLGITGTWPISGTGSARMRAHGATSFFFFVFFAAPPTKISCVAARLFYCPAGRGAGRLIQPNAATSPRWTWRRRPSVPAWRSTRATPRCSTPRASRSRCARRWRSSTRPSTRRWPSRKATSTPTAAGR